MYGCYDDDPTTYEESRAVYERICGYSEQRLVTRDMCFDYFFFGYYPDMLNAYCDQEKIDDRRKEQLGLVKMFNEEWLTSPVFVNWNNEYVGFLKDIRGFRIEDWLFPCAYAEILNLPQNYKFKSVRANFRHKFLNISYFKERFAILMGQQ